MKKSYQIFMGIILLLFLINVVLAIGRVPMAVNGFVKGSNTSSITLTAFNEGTMDIITSSEAVMTSNNGEYFTLVTVDSSNSIVDLSVHITDGTHEFSQRIYHVAAFDIINLNFSLEGSWIIEKGNQETDLPPIGSRFDKIDEELRDGTSPIDVAHKYELNIRHIPADYAKEKAPLKEKPAQVYQPKSMHVWMMIFIFVLILILIHVIVSRDK